MWLSVDPLAEKMPDFSAYAYAFNNPVMFVDPTGMQGEGVKPYGPNDPPIYFVKGDCYCSYYDDHGRMVTQSPNGIDDFLNNFDTFEDFVPNFEKPILHVYRDYSVLFDEVWADKHHQDIEGLKVLALGLLTIADININVVGKGALTRNDFKLNLKFSPKFNAQNNSAAKGGYGSFNAFKSAFGSAGKGNAWHHIVEQSGSNVSKFGAESIHNVNNLIKLPHGAGSIHAKVSGFYSSKQAFTGGQTVRQWLGTQSFQQQYDFGIKTLKQFGWTP